MRNVGSLTTNMEEGSQRATNDRNQRILALKYDTCENLTSHNFNSLIMNINEEIKHLQQQVIHF